MRRHRQVFVASVITVAISATLLGLIVAMRWGGRAALQSDTSTVLSQASAQLVRALQSRRGTLTLVRDTLKRRADLSAPQLQALGASAVEHTRHLIGIGLLQPDKPPAWWSGPSGISAADLAELHDAAQRRALLRNAWRVPATFVVTTRSGRSLLVMLEPIRSATLGPTLLAGVLDLKPLLEDFFTSGIVQGFPSQFLDGETVLYRSADWQEATKDHAPVTTAQPVRVDAVQWTLQMQPGATRVVQTLSWLNVLLVALGAVAGIGVIGIVWILAARTWILQRAVMRRTAALRRSRERLRQMATTDELTGLYNRRFFLNRWDWECDRAKRYQRPLACLMIDVNGFKQINDRLGHLTGDTVLRRVAQELKVALRQSDILARFGGDEFVAALPETNEVQAKLVADKLRHISIPVEEGRSKGVGAISLSVGIGRIKQPDETPEDVLEAADQSLYASKRLAKAQAAKVPAGRT